MNFIFHISISFYVYISYRFLYQPYKTINICGSCKSTETLIENSSASEKWIKYFIQRLLKIRYLQAMEMLHPAFGSYISSVYAYVRKNA